LPVPAQPLLLEQALHDTQVWQAGKPAATLRAVQRV